jgi:hypothetical protein
MTNERYISIRSSSWGPEQRQDPGLGDAEGVAQLLGRLVPGFMGGESQGESGTPVEGQLDRVIEVTVEGVQDGEWVIHGA